MIAAATVSVADDNVMSMDYYIVTTNNLTISDPATNDTRNKPTDRSPPPPEQGQLITPALDGKHLSL